MPPHTQLLDLPSAGAVDHAALFAGKCDGVVIVGDASLVSWPRTVEALLPDAAKLLVPDRRLRIDRALQAAQRADGPPPAGSLPSHAAGASTAGDGVVTDFAAGAEGEAVVRGVFHPVLILLNKCDRSRADAPVTGEQLARHHGCLVAEGSARTGEHVVRSIKQFVFALAVSLGMHASAREDRMHASE